MPATKTLKPLPKCKNYRHNVHAALKGVRSLLKDQRHWCRGATAILQNGRTSANAQGDDVVRVCTMGAVMRLICDDLIFTSQVVDRLNMTAHSLYDCSIISVNDGRGYDAVMKMLNKAVEDTDPKKGE